MPSPEHDVALVEALDSAVEKVSAALAALDNLRVHERGVRGGGEWSGGWQAVVEAEGAARTALHQARAGRALLRFSLDSDPLVLQRML